MGRKNHVLRKGDLAITLLFFKLNEDCHSDWRSREGDKPTPDAESKNTSRILHKLAPHFMNFESKAKEVAENITKNAIQDERDKFNRAHILTAIIGALITVMIVSFNAFTFYKQSNLVDKQSNLDYQQSKLDARLTILEAGPKFEEKLDELKESELLKLEERLEQLEGHLATIEENISEITSRIGQ